MEFCKRKSPRLRDYDYSSNGVYFITVCTEEKRCVLSSIIGEGSPLPKLTKSGEILQKWIKSIPEKYSTVSVEAFVIMPNHFHLLLFLSDFCESGSVNGNGRGNPSPTDSSVVRGVGDAIAEIVGGRGNPSPTDAFVKKGLECTHLDVVREGFPLPKLAKGNESERKGFGDAISDIVGEGSPLPKLTKSNASVDRVLGWLKYNVTKEYNAYLGTAGKRLFQRSFHDHIVRNQKDFLEIYRYIEENPLKWTMDCFYVSK